LGTQAVPPDVAAERIERAHRLAAERVGTASGATIAAAALGCASNGQAQTEVLDDATRRAAVAKVGVSIIALFTALGDAVSTCRHRLEHAARGAAIAEGKVAVVALLTHLRDPVTAHRHGLDGASGRTAIAQDQIAVVALFAHLGDPISAHRHGLKGASGRAAIAKEGVPVVALLAAFCGTVAAKGRLSTRFVETVAVEVAHAPRSCPRHTAHRDTAERRRHHALAPAEGATTRPGRRTVGDL
jgi:hypothetical protein